MIIRFPYEKIKHNERVVIYGAGGLGQELFWKIRGGQYCTLVGVVDKQFGDEVQPPFYPIEKLQSLLYDKIVIASASPRVTDKIFLDIKKMGVNEDKVIANYAFDDIGFPSVNTAKEFVKKYDFYKGLVDICNSSKSEFAGTFIYQSYPELGIEGKRDTAERLRAYQMENYLTRTDRVLDIGCNCGFLDMNIAPLVKSIKGVDVDEGLIGMAEYVRSIAGVENATFVCRDIFKEPLNEKYDAVCIFAVHDPIIMYSGMNEETFASKVLDLLNNNGLIFFESHAYLPGEDDDLYRKLDVVFRENGMDLLSYRKHYGKTAANCNRDISVYKKL